MLWMAPGTGGCYGRGGALIGTRGMHGQRILRELALVAARPRAPPPRPRGAAWPQNKIAFAIRLQYSRGAHRPGPCECHNFTLCAAALYTANQVLTAVLFLLLPTHPFPPSLNMPNRESSPHLRVQSAFQPSGIATRIASRTPITAQSRSPSPSIAKPKTHVGNQVPTTDTPHYPPPPLSFLCGRCLRLRCRQEHCG